MAPSAEDRAAPATDPTRYLKILARAPDGDSFGSGYQLGGGLAVTAAHVVGGAQRIDVRSPGAPWAPAAPVWVDPAHDLALLRVTQLPDVPALPAVPLGRLEARTAMEFSAVGYPLAQAQQTGGTELRDSEQVLGFLAPQTHLETGRLALHARTGSPNPLPDGRSPWAGMSGAAVIVDGCVVAVVIHDPAAFGPDRLVGQPVEALWQSPAAAAALQAAGVIGTVLRQPPADGAAPQAEPAPGERVVGERVSTSMDVFTDRSELRALLRRVLLGSEAHVVAVFGRRGVGKSALVAKVMADLESDPAAGLQGVCYLSSRTGNNRLDLPRILGSAARLLAEPARQQAEGVIASAGHTPRERCAYLLDALGDRRWAMVLDDLDPFQDATGELLGGDVLTFLEAVGRAQHPPTLLLTSRLAPLLPATLLGLRIQPVEMVEGIPADLGAALLVRLDALGQAGMAALDEPARAKLVEAVHGIPRALELLVGLRARNPLLPPDRLLAQLLQSPQALEELVSTTYGELPAEQLAAVRVLAVLGVPIDAETVVALCGDLQPGPDYASGVDQLVATRVVGLESATSRIRLHPLDAEVVIGGLPAQGPWSLVSLSASVADFYRRRTVPVAQWRTGADLEAPLAEARHRIRAGDVARATEILLGVARSGARGGEGASVLALLTTLDPLLDQPRDIACHRLALAYAHHVFGPNEAAIVAAAEAAGGFAALQAEALQAEALSIAADALRYAGRFGESIRDSTAALALTDDGTPTATRGLMLLRLGLAQVYGGRIEDAARTAEAIAALDPAGGTAALQAVRCDLLSLCRLVAGDPGSALALAQEGAQHYRRSEVEPENACYVLNVAGLANLLLGQPELARTAFSEGMGMAAAMRLPRAEGFNAYNLTWALVLSGRAAEAGEAAGRAARGFLEDGGVEVAVARSLERCLAAIRGGDADTALQQLAAITSGTAPNPELHSPTADALGAIRALIHAAAEAARGG